MLPGISSQINYSPQIHHSGSDFRRSMDTGVWYEQRAMRMQRGRGLILAGEDLASFECGLGGGNECTCGKRCFRQSKQGHDGVEEHNALREL